MDRETVRALWVGAAGTGFGSLVTVLLGHLDSFLHFRRRGLGAALLIKWELGENRGFVNDVGQHGFTRASPIHAKKDMWLAHGVKLAERRVPAAVLADIQLAYSLVGTLESMLEDIRSGRADEVRATQQELEKVHRAVDKAITAIEPYCLSWYRRPLWQAKRRKALVNGGDKSADSQ